MAAQGSVARPVATHCGRITRLIWKTTDYPLEGTQGAWILRITVQPENVSTVQEGRANVLGLAICHGLWVVGRQ